MGLWVATTVKVLLPLWILSLTLAGQHAIGWPGKEKIGYPAYGLTSRNSSEGRG